jgi:DNA-binding transcriptional MerR regulator
MTGMTIGEVAKRSGLPPKTIRFYEERGLLPPQARTQAGYRVYTEADLVRLVLVKRAKLLGLRLTAIQTLVERALSDECAAFADELLATIERQRVEVESRMAELQALRDELDSLERHVQHCCEGCTPGEMSAECGFCGLIEAEKGGDPS